MIPVHVRPEWRWKGRGGTTSAAPSCNSPQSTSTCRWARYQPAIPPQDIGYCSYCPAPPRHAPHHPPPLPLGRRFSGYGVVIRRGAGNTDLPHGSRQGLFDSVCDGGGRSRALTGSRDSCGGGGLGCLLLIVMLVAVLGVLLQALGDTQADLRRGKEEGGALEDAQTQNLRGGEKGMEGASGG